MVTETDFNQDDFRSEDAKKYDALNEQITTLLKKFDKVLENKSANQEVHVTHKTEGPGGLIGAAITVGFCAMIMLVGFMVWAIPEIHDLRAWRDIHQNHISSLEAKEQKK